jgi:ubiquinone/menaquinone biosynthesis C-methylase UbiE
MGASGVKFAAFKPGESMRLMANPYYRSGAKLREKNELAGGPSITVPEFALATLPLDRMRSALDVGCGWGRFARPLLQKATELDLVCSDVWPGMIESCRGTLAEAHLRACFVVADARRLPFRNAAVDLVMANHMLYEFHDDDLRRVIGELARVLRRGATLLATTYSDALPVPMTDLHHGTLAALGHPYARSRPSSFALENGAALLERSFATVRTHILEEVQSVTDADSFAELYTKTGGFHWASTDHSIPARARSRIADTFRSLAQSQIDALGSITTVTKWTAFVATAP